MRKCRDQRADDGSSMTRQIRVAIATAGRFHVLDLARELNALGYAVDFYSYVPKSRAKRFGLPRACHRSLVPFVLPALAVERFAPAVPPVIRERLLYKSLNLAITARMRNCDLFICMSGIYLEAARFAKRRFGSAIWLERGSRHILSQDEILADIPGATRPTSLTIHRELAGYELADRIVIPSAHVAESFRRDPSAFAKLFMNPYGVDLEMFPTARPRHDFDKEFTLLFVGSWTLRKGCDLLVSAIARNSGSAARSCGVNWRRSSFSTRGSALRSCRSRAADAACEILCRGRRICVGLAGGRLRRRASPGTCERTSDHLHGSYRRARSGAHVCACTTHDHYTPRRLVCAHCRCGGIARPSQGG